MTVYADNVALFATTREMRQRQIDNVLNNLDADLSAARGLPVALSIDLVDAAAALLEVMGA